jgi:hypothetical protein
VAKAVNDYEMKVIGKVLGCWNCFPVIALKAGFTHNFEVLPRHFAVGQSFIVDHEDDVVHHPQI